MMKIEKFRYLNAFRFDIEIESNSRSSIHHYPKASDIAVLYFMNVDMGHSSNLMLENGGLLLVTEDSV